MSTRAIAPIVGVHHDTVASDIKASGPVGNPTPPMNAVEPQTMMRVNPDTGKVEDVPARHITGMDGKDLETSGGVSNLTPVSHDTPELVAADMRGGRFRPPDREWGTVWGTVQGVSTCNLLHLSAFVPRARVTTSAYLRRSTPNRRPQCKSSNPPFSADRPPSKHWGVFCFARPGAQFGAQLRAQHSADEVCCTALK